MALSQSVREKKSASTLNEPQAVQRNGKAAKKSHSTTMPSASAKSAGGWRRARADGIIAQALRLNSRQLRISTGVRRITTPMMVSIEVAAAEPNRGESPLRRSLKISQLSDVALAAALKPMMGSKT